MDAAFAALRGGINFDKRQARGMSVFQNTSRGGSTTAPVAAPATLDFFGIKRKEAGRSKKPTDPSRTGDADGEAENSDEQSDGENDQQVEKTVQERMEESRQWALATEEVNQMRKQQGIKLSGGAAPAPLRDFSELVRYKCKPFLLRSLAANGFGAPTPIQAQAIPALLKGAELLAIAPTGSGKTLAFLVPIVVGLKGHVSGGPRALLLCPTRELANQTTRVLRVLLHERAKLLRTAVVSKANMGSVEWNEMDIVLANPLRLNALLEGGKVNLSGVRFLVLDEADKLFEMGFVEQIDAAVGACTHPDIQRCLFSATLPETVEELARSVIPAPLRVTVGERNTVNAAVTQRLLFVGQEEGKLMAVRQLIHSGALPPPAIVFVQSKERAKALYHELRYDGLRVGAIHADISASKRAAAVDQFRGGEMWFLIATDLMARGVDFVGVNAVLNYDFPESAISYIHRVGRTGRAGREGTAVTLFTEDDGAHGELRSIVNVMRASGCSIPDWMMTLKKPQRKRKHRPGLGEEGMNEEQIGASKNKGQRIAGGKESGKVKTSGPHSQAKEGSTKARGGGKDIKAKRAGVSTVPLFDMQRKQKKQQIIDQSKRKHAAAF